MNRRGFLRGFAGLAAAAVVAQALPIVALPKSDQERLVEQMKRGGVIRGQTFFVDGLVAIVGVSDLLIDECVFVIRNPHPDYCLRVEKAERVTVSNCVFYSEDAYRRRFA
jgi:hypothetical protein